MTQILRARHRYTGQFGLSSQSCFPSPMTCHSPTIADGSWSMRKLVQTCASRQTSYYCRSGNIDVVNTLLIAGSIATIQNKNKLTPIGLAEKMGDSKLAALLYKHTPQATRLAPINKSGLASQKDHSGLGQNQAAHYLPKIPRTAAASSDSSDDSESDSDSDSSTDSSDLSDDEDSSKPGLHRKTGAGGSTKRKAVEESGQLVIFLSSPFNGLRDERDIFINRYLPLLRGQAENKGVMVKVIDLRWGISSQQSNDGMTLTICLSGVLETNLFLGFYGARYGTVWNPSAPSTNWVKKDFDVALKDPENRFAWISKFITRAVTELEFRAGWLNFQGVRPAAFYFRDAAYDAAKAKQLESDPDPEQQREARHYKNPFESDWKKLEALRQDCRDCAKTTSYFEPADAAKMFNEQCEEWMVDVLPETGAGAMGAEDGAHKAFAAARTQMYVQDADQVSDIINFVLSPADGKQMLVLEGSSGAGKSALVANFVRNFKEQTARDHRDDTVVQHYIGCSSESTHLGNMLRRLCYHLMVDRRHTPEQIDAVEKGLPKETEFEELIDLFHAQVIKKCEKLKKKGGNRLLILVIDALTQLDKIDFEVGGRDVTPHHLDWLVPQSKMPSNLRVILASLDGRPIDVLRSRTDTEFVHCLPLSKNDRKNFCETMLKKAGKTLKDNQLRQVVYGEAYMLPKAALAKLLKKKDGRHLEFYAVYVVVDAGAPRVNGRYIESATEVVDGKPVYVKKDDIKFKLSREEGVWMLKDSSKAYYMCPHGTDTPPSLGWIPAAESAGAPPTLRCLVPPTHLPLFLKLAMEELCAFGIYEELDNKIRDIASCGSIPTLLLLMLDRLQNGFDDKEAVRTVFSQIWCSRNGMMASELCDLAGIANGQASQQWALLFSALKPFLSERAGRYTFLHNYIKLAVEARYCPTTGHRWSVASKQFYHFYDTLTRDDASAEKKQRAEEELEDLQRFVDARVLQSADLEAQTEELDFTDNDVGVDVAKAIGQGLQTSHTLVRLYLSGNGIGDKGCEAICLALHGNRVLADLDISHNGITNTGAQKIGSALQANRSVVRFNFANNYIGPIGAKALGTGIAINETVTYLNCSQNEFGPEGTKPLARALKENETITEFCLEGKSFLGKGGDGRIKDAGAIEIGKAMAENEAITKIYLGKNGIQDTGCAAVFEACKQNGNIEEVHLNDNELSTVGARGLCEFLSVCRTLTVLDISSNELGNEGVSALAPALSKNTTLLELNLSYNKIADAGARALGEFLDRNGTLRVLKLAGNMIDDRGVHFIAQALQSNDAAVQKQLINMWKNEVGYLKQWKNRNHLQRAPGDATEVDLDGDGVADADSASRTVMSLEQLSAALRKIDRKGRNGSGRKAAVPRTIRKQASRDHTVRPTSASPSENSTDAVESNGGSGDKKGRRGKGGGLGPDRVRDTVITYLDLTENVFSAEGARAIGMALQRNNILEELLLNGNQLTDIGAESVVEALKDNNVLLRLHMVGCGASDVAMKSFGDSMKKTANNKANAAEELQRWSLQWIDLRHNDISDEGLRHLANAMRGATKNTLKEMDFRENPAISTKGARDFALALDDNSTLQLSTVHWPIGVSEDIQKIITGLCEANTMPPAQRESYKKRKDFRGQLKMKKRIMRDGDVDDPRLDSAQLDSVGADGRRDGPGPAAGSTKTGRGRRQNESLPEVADVGLVVQVAAKGRISATKKKMSRATTVPPIIETIT